MLTKKRGVALAVLIAVAMVTTGVGLKIRATAHRAADSGTADMEQAARQQRRRVFQEMKSREGQESLLKESGYQRWQVRSRPFDRARLLKWLSEIVYSCMNEHQSDPAFKMGVARVKLKLSSAEVRVALDLLDANGPTTARRSGSLESCIETRATADVSGRLDAAQNIDVVLPVRAKHVH